jgi:uncharacterized protein
MKNTSLHKPITRQCVACRKEFERTDLFRLVHRRDDASFRLLNPPQAEKISSGRSAYLCSSEACLQIALKGKKLQKSLKTSIPDDILKYLNDLLKGTIPRGCTQS